MTSWARKLPSLDTLRKKLRPERTASQPDLVHASGPPLEFHLKSPSPEPPSLEEEDKASRVSGEDEGLGSEDAVYDTTDNLAR